MLPVLVTKSGIDIPTFSPVVEAQVTVDDPDVVATFVNVTGAIHPPPSLPDPPVARSAAVIPPPPPDVELPLNAPLQDGQALFVGVVKSVVGALSGAVNMVSNMNLPCNANPVEFEF